MKIIIFIYKFKIILCKTLFLFYLNLLFNYNIYSIKLDNINSSKINIYNKQQDLNNQKTKNQINLAKYLNHTKINNNKNKLRYSNNLTSNNYFRFTNSNQSQNIQDPYISAGIPFYVGKNNPFIDQPLTKENYYKFSNDFYFIPDKNITYLNEYDFSNAYLNDKLKEKGIDYSNLKLVKNCNDNNNLNNYTEFKPNEIMNTAINNQDARYYINKDLLDVLSYDNNPNGLLTNPYKLIYDNKDIYNIKHKNDIKLLELMNEEESKIYKRLQDTLYRRLDKLDKQISNPIYKYNSYNMNTYRN